MAPTVSKRWWNTLRWFSSTPTQADAFVGGSSKSKFCSASRPGIQLMGKFSRAAALRMISPSCSQCERDCCLTIISVHGIRAHQPL